MTEKINRFGIGCLLIESCKCIIPNRIFIRILGIRFIPSLELAYDISRIFELKIEEVFIFQIED